jgi:hypothetical protein
MRTNTCVSYLAKSALALASASADGAADAVAFRGFASAALVDGVQIAHPLRLARSANVVVRSHRTAAAYKRKWHSRRFRERGSQPLNRYLLRKSITLGREDCDRVRIQKRSKARAVTIPF